MEDDASGSWHFAHIYNEKTDSSDQEIVKINAVELITEHTLAQYRDDKRRILEYFSTRSLVMIVQMNIHQFLEAVVHYGGTFLKTRQMGENQFDEMSLNFSRLLLNILSMFRSLLDHSEFSLSREFGQDSDQFKLWKTTLSAAFDSSFEYRFFYKLRNYSQHLGVPPISMSFTDTKGTEGIGFRIDFSRDALLEEESLWGAKVKNDLANAPEKIPVIDSLDKWGTSFHQISKLLLQIRRAGAVDSATRIVGHRIRLGLPATGNVCVLRLPESDTKPASLNLRLDWLPEQKAQQIFTDDPFAPQSSAPDNATS